jgi:hypothetical protein
VKVERRGFLFAGTLIVLMLAGLGLYSFGSGYRMGSDMAQHDNPN